jgi:hypothetical protein
VSDNRSEPLRDQIGRVLYEEGGVRSDWHLLSEARREPWRKDADRVTAMLMRDGLLAENTDANLRSANSEAEGG